MGLDWAPLRKPVPHEEGRECGVPLRYILQHSISEPQDHPVVLLIIPNFILRCLHFFGNLVMCWVLLRIAVVNWDK